MPAPFQRVFDAQRALLQTSQDIGLRTLDGASRLSSLTAQATSALLAAGTEQMASVMRPGGGQAISNNPPAAQRADAIASAYVRQCTEIVSETGGELARLLQRQASELQTLAGVWAAVFWQGVPVDPAQLRGLMPGSVWATQPAAGHA